MQFNLDPNKQVQEVYFLKKLNIENSFPVTFNNAKVVTWSTHKHLGLLLDKQLSFNEHIQSKMNKCYKMIGVIKRLSINIPRDALLRIYKLFIRPHLHYRDIIYDKPPNESFKNKIENIQYEVYIAITGAIPFYVNEWCKLDISLRKAKNIKLLSLC